MPPSTDRRNRFGDSWEGGRKRREWGRFSPDGRTLVVPTDSAETLRLIETETGRELAQLEEPRVEPHNVAFAPDGSRLLVCSATGIHVWDLRRIRAELAERGLDWDAPAYAPAPAPAETLQVELDLGDFQRLRPQRLEDNFDRAVSAADHLAARWWYRSKFHRKAGRYDKAIRDMRGALQRLPDYHRNLDGLACLYVLAPEPLRDTRAAIALAERAVKLQPGKCAYYTTLGIAYYRAGRFHDAVAELQKSLAGGAPECAAANLYFLALCHHRLGDESRAQDCLARAWDWQERQSGRLSEEDAAECKTFRTKAETALAPPSAK
jgi:tetratricopeptide (TPR) repeat protein